MARITRRNWVSGAAVTAALATPALIRPARAADFTWRAGHTAPVSFPVHRRLLEAAKEIEDKSAGRMTMSVQGDGQLGSAMGQLTQVRNGGLDLAPVTGQVLSNAQGMAALPMTGFAWSGYDTVWKAIDGDLGRLVRDLARDRSGLLVMDTVWDFGFRVITTGSKPVKTAPDLQGLRLRTPVEPDFVSLFQALKASPIAMPLGDTYRALAQGQVDGQEGLLALVVAAGFQAVQRFCAITNHIWDGQWICVNPGQWRRLPDDLKAIVATALNTAGERQRKDHAEADAASRESLKTANVTINAIDQASFRAALREAGYYRDLRRKLGSSNWDILEKYTGRLA